MKLIPAVFACWLMLVLGVFAKPGSDLRVYESAEFYYLLNGGCEYRGDGFKVDVTHGQKKKNELGGALIAAIVKAGKGDVKGGLPQAKWYVRLKKKNANVYSFKAFYIRGGKVSVSGKDYSETDFFMLIKRIQDDRREGIR